MIALQSLVCCLVYCPSRGWFGSSSSGSPISARSATSTSKPPWARARSTNHSAMGWPARPGRVEPTMTVSVGMVGGAPVPWFVGGIAGPTSAEAQAGDGFDQFAFLVGQVGPEGIAEQVGGVPQAGQGRGPAAGRDERHQRPVHAVEDVVDDPVLGLPAGDDRAQPRVAA